MTAAMPAPAVPGLRYRVVAETTQRDYPHKHISAELWAEIDPFQTRGTPCHMADWPALLDWAWGAATERGELEVRGYRPAPPVRKLS